MVEKKKSLLVVSYYYPPIKAIGCLRTYFFVKNLSSFGWTPYIYTTSNRDFLGSDNYYGKLATANVIPVPTFDLVRVKHLVKNWLGRGRRISPATRAPGGAGPEYAAPASLFLKFYHKLLRSLPFSLIHEGGFLYSFWIFITGSGYIKREGIECIYSTYSPFANHLAAWLLKIRHPQVRWIADFRDLLPGETEDDIFLPRLQTWFNRLVLGRADFVVTVSQGLKDSFQKYNEKVVVIKNGIPIENTDDLFSDLPTTELPGDGKFRIAYTGILYDGKRDPSLLFEALASLAGEGAIGGDFAIAYAGKDGDHWNRCAEKFGLMGNVENFGEIGRDEAMALQKKASLNLMLTWANSKEKGWLTAKFFEYLAAEKPILCIIDGERDEELEKLYADLNAGIIAYNDRNELRELSEFILERYRAWENGAAEWRYDKQYLKCLTYEHLTKRLEQVMTEPLP
ncbi:glycosyltransferase [Geobacter sp.]|uniref:glycosyltransferase n=1 Tax=Geobacter sp. TaxID=46610 RepID=UPI001AD48EA8|nr:glycosyltransferase [Geobacter sp.]CAG0947561.1 hypothetical protein ANRL1_04271 [Anaerolineae bacterium]